MTWRAIELYLKFAYPAPPGGSVASRLAALRATSDESFFNCPSFERTPKENPTRFDLRLGNRWYPHMKLVIRCAPDQVAHLFAADAHDRHIQPVPGSRDYEAFKQLMEKNGTIAAQIESAWEAEGIPTFKSFLRQDLARRQRVQDPSRDNTATG
jgi:hypothetical protein